MIIRKWHLWLLAAIILILVGIFLGWKFFAGGLALLGGIGAKEVKKNKSALEHTEKNQEKRKEEVDKIQNDKEDRDEAFEKFKKNIKKNGPKLLIFFLIIFITTIPGLAQEKREVPDDYEQLKELYFKALDRNAELANQRDQAIEFAEGYKKDYEMLKIKYDAAEDDIDFLQERLKDSNEIIEKQDKVIEKLSGKNLGMFGGINYVPAEPENTGIILGASLLF